MEYLKFKTVNLLTLLAAALLLLARLWAHIPWGVFALLGILWLTLTAIGSFNILWRYHVDSLNSNPKASGKTIALTFDDGPHPEFTPQVLDLLAKHQVQATFFCIGRNMEKHPELLQKIVAEGHLIGNHSYSHSDYFGFYGAKKVLAELEKTNSLALQYTGKRLKLFRPPFGVTNPSIKKALTRSGHTTIGWNLRSLDTVISQKDRILRRITGRLKGGDIVLLHDTHSRTVDTLRELLPFLKKNRLEAVRVDELLNIDAYA